MSLLLANSCISVWNESCRTLGQDDIFTSIAMEVSKTVFYEKKKTKTNATRRSCPSRIINRASEVWQMNKNRRKQNFQKLSTASYMPWKAYLLKTLKYLTRTNIFQAKLIVTSQNGDILIATGAPVKHCILGQCLVKGRDIRFGQVVQFHSYDGSIKCMRNCWISDGKIRRGCPCIQPAPIPPCAPFCSFFTHLF